MTASDYVLSIVINNLFSYRKILTASSEYDIRFYPEFKIFIPPVSTKLCNVEFSA